MLHKDRIWAVADVDDSWELARKLTQFTWTLCTGFRHRGYLYLNDSFSENGAQEYAVIKESTEQQVETITFSWYAPEGAVQQIWLITTGTFDDQAWDPGIDLKTQIQPAEGHKCHLCA